MILRCNACIQESIIEESRCNEEEAWLEALEEDEAAHRAAFDNGAELQHHIRESLGFNTATDSTRAADSTQAADSTGQK